VTAEDLSGRLRHSCGTIGGTAADTARINYLLLSIPANSRCLIDLRPDSGV